MSRGKFIQKQVEFFELSTFSTLTPKMGKSMVSSLKGVLKIRVISQTRGLPNIATNKELSMLTFKLRYLLQYKLLHMLITFYEPCTFLAQIKFLKWLPKHELSPRRISLISNNKKDSLGNGTVGTHITLLHNRVIPLLFYLFMYFL